MRVAWLFPGQGSQSVGMASGWARVSPEAAATLEEAADVLGFDLPGLIANGPPEALNDTYNQQSALLAASVAILRGARAAELLPDAEWVAGHSLGEYSALVAAGAMTFPDALRLVRERGRLMRLAGERRPGGMAAVLGLDDAVVAAVCDRIDGAQVANYNAPGQVVISGTAGGVEAASEALKAAGARRLIPLPITIAAHSPLMTSVAEEWEAAVAQATVVDSVIPVVCNLTAQAVTSVDALRRELVGQLTGSVRWTESLSMLADSGAEAFYEVGPGNVLVGLAKRILADRPAIRLVALAEPPS